MPTTRYAIIQNGQPMDGEFFSEADLLRYLVYADHDARIAEIDLDAMTMRDVTVAMALQWVNSKQGWDDIANEIEAGRDIPGLAFRFAKDECLALQQRVEAA